MTVDELIDDIIRREGGFVDHPADRGGPTKYGITQSTLAAWRHRTVSRDDILNLSEDEARAIYRKKYVEDPGFADLPDPLRELLVDSAVHSGPMAVIIWVQRALGIMVDGYIGPQTKAALKDAKPDWLYRQILASRLIFIGHLITSDPTQAAFAGGWMARLSEFVRKTPCSESTAIHYS
jgi:lysozyme family protein